MILIKRSMNNPYTIYKDGKRSPSWRRTVEEAIVDYTQRETWPKDYTDLSIEEALLIGNNSIEWYAKIDWSLTSELLPIKHPELFI